uniref:hypothetical protein n=1 Tax=Nonomuraea pusilla TaxID=46177 RepID=UPI0006E3AC78|nr:hypothetical protein [Nonomuraea pusilla]
MRTDGNRGRRAGATGERGIDAVMRALARVEPGGAGADPSGAGARTLLAAITAHQPTADGATAGAPGAAGRRRDRRRRRLALGLAAVTVLTAALVVGPSLVGGGGAGSASYAVTKSSDGIVTIEVRDFRDAPKLQQRLRELNVPAIVDHVPEGMVCQGERGESVADVPRGLYHAPSNIPGEPDGWRMRIDTRLFKPGQTFVWQITDLADGGSSTSTILMRDPVAPCVLAPEPLRTLGDRLPAATREGGSLSG